MSAPGSRPADHPHPQGVGAPRIADQDVARLQPGQHTRRQRLFVENVAGRDQADVLSALGVDLVAVERDGVFGVDAPDVQARVGQEGCG